MTLSDKGLEFIKEREGYRESAYRDDGGVWTIGFGTTWIDGRRVTFGDTCTLDQALSWIGRDLDEAANCINNNVRRELTQNEFDALVSLVYNIGCLSFKKSSLVKVLNKGGIPYRDLFLRWNKVTHPVTGKKVVSNGLRNRREKEWSFYTERLA